MARLIDTSAASNKIHEYMEDFPRAETRLATCRVILSMLGDENQIHSTEIVEGREQRIWKMPPSEDRAKNRAKTFPGIARAMAEQWAGDIREGSQCKK